MDSHDNRLARAFNLFHSQVPKRQVEASGRKVDNRPVFKAYSVIKRFKGLRRVNMKYREVKIYASREGIEQITAMMLGMGVDQLSIDDPEDFDDILNKKHEYGWDYIENSLKENLKREPAVFMYFDCTEEGDRLVDSVKNEIEGLKRSLSEGKFGWEADFGSLRIEEKIVDDADWKDRWKEFFKPARVSKRIVVKPSWESYHKEAGQVVVEIDPGMAFGTGTHETTSLCIRLMEKYLGENSLSQDCCNKKVLDVGCGSGILSICAALLGCRDVLGIEIDEDAVRVAEENVRLNGAEASVRVQQGDLTKGVDFKADIIVANLMADLVMALASDAGKHLKSGGVFISSGVLTEKKAVVCEAIREAGFKIEEVLEEGEWCAIAAKLNERI